MNREEFEELSGFEPTDEEYKIIEEDYLSQDKSLSDFCYEFSKNGEASEFYYARAERIKELEEQIKKLEEENMLLKQNIIQLQGQQTK